MTNSFKIPLALSVAFLACPSYAKDMSSLYDVVTLEQWAPRYSASTNRILNDFAFKYLTAEEKRKLAGIAIEFPLMAGGPLKGDPLQFYTLVHPSRVVFPIFSLKFLDDLSIAYAWLQLNGYKLDTVSEYTSMLAYNDFGGHYPAPQQALHIPTNALQDENVDKLAVKHFVTARMFILLHELGHVYYNHEMRLDRSSIAQEEQADQFAIDVMSRSEVAPLGILVYFIAESSMAEYPPVPRTHPLSGHRLQALGAKLQDPQLSAMMKQLGEWVDDPDIRAGAVLAAKATDERSLTPRRGHRATLQPSRSVGAVSLPFHGRCSGQLTQLIDRANSIPMEMALQRTGNNVRGQYSFGLGIGIIAGTVTGDTLNLEWQWGNNYGRGILRATNNGSALAGEWGYHELNGGGGTWSCRFN